MRNREKTKLVLACIAKGLTKPQTQRETGVSEGYVWQMFRKHKPKLGGMNVVQILNGGVAFTAGDLRTPVFTKVKKRFQDSSASSAFD